MCSSESIAILHAGKAYVLLQGDVKGEIGERFIREVESSFPDIVRDFMMLTDSIWYHTDMYACVHYMLVFVTSELRVFSDTAVDRMPYV